MTDKMKTLTALIIVLVLAFSFGGCGGNDSDNPYESDIDSELFAGYLAKKISFTDIMSELDDDSAAMLYGLYGLTESDYDDIAVYASTGATAEEIAVISVDNDTQAEAVIKVLEGRVSAQIESFKNYVPGEVEKLSSAVIEQTGDVVVLCVCDNYDEYISARDAFISEK